MICPTCGAANENGVLVCGNCGSRLTPPPLQSNYSQQHHGPHSAYPQQQPYNSQQPYNTQQPPGPGSGKKKGVTAIVITVVAVIVVALIVVGIVTKGFGLFGGTDGTDIRSGGRQTGTSDSTGGTRGLGNDSDDPQSTNGTQGKDDNSGITTGGGGGQGGTQGSGSGGEPGGAQSNEPLTLFPPYLQLPLSQHVTLEARTTTGNSLTWSSSNPAVVTVDNNGRLTPLTEGEAIITVAFSDDPGVTAACGVLVVAGGNIFIWEG